MGATLSTPCREYQGTPNAGGYGVRQRKKTVREFGTAYVHRQILMMAGVDTEGLVVRHKCDNRICFRFDHLEVGTHQDNVRDMVERGRNYVPPVLDECKNGHAFTEENTYIHPKYGSQECRTCRRAASARYYKRSVV